MFPKAKEFSKFFDRMKVDVNDPRFMKWMDRATEHTPKFFSEYNKLWKQYIDAVQGKMVNEKHLLKKAKEFEKRAQKVSDEYYKKLKKG